jgi:hypothetical protein
MYACLPRFKYEHAVMEKGRRLRAVMNRRSTGVLSSIYISKVILKVNIQADGLLTFDG